MIYLRSSHGVTFQPQTLFKCLLSVYSALVVHDRSRLHSEGYIRFKEDRYSVDMINPRAQNWRGSDPIYISCQSYIHAFTWPEWGSSQRLSVFYEKQYNLEFLIP